MSEYLTDAQVTKRTMDTLTVLRALAEAEATVKSLRETHAVLVAALEEMLEAIPDLTSDTDPRSWPDVRKAEARVRGIMNAALARAAEDGKR